MVKNSLGIMITDNKIYLCNKTAIYEEDIKDIIKYNRIAKAEAFYRFMVKTLKKYKLNDSLIGKNVYILKFPNYLDSDEELITSIFEKLSFNKIKFLDYLDLTNQTPSFYLSGDNAILRIDNKAYFIDFQIFQNPEEYILYLLKLLTNEQNLFLFGDIPNLNDIRSQIEQEKNIKTYTYHNAATYLISQMQQLIEK